MARLKPGQTVEDTTTALRGVQGRIRDATLPPWSEALLAGYLREPFTLVSAATGNSDLRGRFEKPLAAMVIAVALVLLVACANIASLLLARALSRRQELSVRLALGGSRWRLARLLLVESLILATAGAGIGLVFAAWSSAVLVRQLATWQDAVFLDLGLDGRVFAFAALLACLLAVVAGVAPVVGIEGIAPGEALKDAGRAISGDRRFAVRAVLVVAQVAVSLVLVVAAGLFLRTFVSLAGVPLGFEPKRLLVADVALGRGEIAPGLGLRFSLWAAASSRSCCSGSRHATRRRSSSRRSCSGRLARWRRGHPHAARPGSVPRACCAKDRDGEEGEM